MGQGEGEFVADIPLVGGHAVGAGRSASEVVEVESGGAGGAGGGSAAETVAAGGVASEAFPSGPVGVGAAGAHVATVPGGEVVVGFAVKAVVGGHAVARTAGGVTGLALGPNLDVP